VTSPEKYSSGTEFIDVATYASGAPAFMAGLERALLADRGCLVVGREQGHCGLVVFRAKDVDWDGDTLTYRGQRYRLGDRIDLMGGYMTLRRLKGLHLPEEWADTAEAFVVASTGP
jgi:hypothetical protein